MKRKKFERFIDEHPQVKSWLENRPPNTRRAFAEALMHFCEAIGMTPEEWRRLDKFEARDLAWKYVQPKVKEHSAVAKNNLAALKNWYRNLNGERLPFDSGRGGKHHIHSIRKKAAYEKIPNKEEVYRVVDMASSLRDKAILLTLFQSGIRLNALCSLLYSHVKDQLDNDIIMLKITWDIDEKLRGSSIPFYYTFVNGEGAETLRQYCELKHKRSEADTPLFYTRSRRVMSETAIFMMFKRCIRRAGFDTRTMWPHSMRKAFRKIVRQANIDDEDKEQLMGHALRGSREAYFDRHDVELTREAYQKCNFAREVPEGEVTKLRRRLEDEQSKRMLNEMRLEKLERELEATRKLLKEMLEGKK